MLHTLVGFRWDERKLTAVEAWALGVPPMYTYSRATPPLWVVAGPTARQQPSSEALRFAEGELFLG